MSRFSTWLSPERIGLMLFMLLAVAPIGFGLVYALGYAFGIWGLFAEGWTLQHWRAGVADAALWRAFGVSLYVATITVALTAAAATGLSLSFRAGLNRGPADYAVYLPLTLPPTVAAFFIYQVFTDGGLLARLGFALGLVDDNPALNLIHDPFSIGVIAAHLVFAVPYITLVFRQVHQHERLDDLCRLTQTLGGSMWDCLRRVIVPIYLRRGRPHLLLLFVVVMSAYEIPLLLGRQSPQMISVFTMRKYAMFDITQKPQAFIAALVYTLVVGVLLALAFRPKRAA